MENNQNDEIEIDLVELFFVLLGKIWAIILSTFVGVAVMALVTLVFMQPVYSSTSMLYILSKSTSLTSLADVQLGSQLTQDYMVFVTSRPVVEKVIQNLDLNMQYEELIGQVEVNNPSNTRILNITVNNHDAYMAKKIVDELTDVSADRMAEIMETDRPNIVDYGHVPKNQSSPSMKKNLAIGGLAGFILACAVVIVAYIMNDSIRSSEDVEKYLGLNTLGTIPLAEGETKEKRKKFQFGKES